MLHRKRAPKFRGRRRGAIVVLAAFLLVVFMAVLALSIDTGVMYNSRDSLQRAVDSGALAAAAELADNPSDVLETGKHFTKLNTVLEENLKDTQITIVTGNWDTDIRRFQSNTNPINAVQIVANQPYTPFFFAPNSTSKQFEIQASATAMFQPRDIMLVLDYSGSMNSESKIDNLKAAVKLFNDLVLTSGHGWDRVGFVRYSDDATLEYTLTTEVNNVTTAAQSSVAAGWTNIGDGIKLALQEFKFNARPGAKKVMLLLTDGLANRPLDVDPVAHVRAMAIQAEHDEIPIITISFGSDADQSLMIEVADITKAKSFHVNTNVEDASTDLIAIFRKVAVNRALQLVD